MKSKSKTKTTTFPEFDAAGYLNNDETMAEYPTYEPHPGAITNDGYVAMRS